jgi:hypothetical protein
MWQESAAGVIMSGSIPYKHREVVKSAGFSEIIRNILASFASYTMVMRAGGRQAG